MDHPNHNRGYRRSNGLATASLVLGIVGLATFCCIYTPIICGSLAIIFALLSRGSEKSLTATAKAGLILGIVGIAAGIAMLVFSFALIFIEFGSFENYLDSIYETNDFYDYFDTNPYYKNPLTLSLFFQQQKLFLR